VDPSAGGVDLVHVPGESELSHGEVPRASRARSPSIGDGAPDAEVPIASDDPDLFSAVLAEGLGGSVGAGEWKPRYPVPGRHTRVNVASVPGLALGFRENHPSTVSSAGNPFSTAASGAATRSVIRTSLSPQCSHSLIGGPPVTFI
jgi:hypothetical protein